MPINHSPPFNLLVWSLTLLALFLTLQALLSFGYAVFGLTLGPFVAAFNWFALSAAVGFGLYTRYQPSMLHMMLLQALSCFYIFALSVAANASSFGGLTGDMAGKATGATLVLFLCGAIGFSFAQLLRHWRSA